MSKRLSYQCVHRRCGRFLHVSRRPPFVAKGLMNLRRSRCERRYYKKTITNVFYLGLSVVMVMLGSAYVMCTVFLSPYNPTPSTLQTNIQGYTHENSIDINVLWVIIVLKGCAI